MADEPDNLVLQLLREIRGKLDDHDRRFESLERRLSGFDGEFAALNQKIDEWQETTATAVGLATHANLRHRALEQQFAELAARVEELAGQRR